MAVRGNKWWVLAVVDLGLFMALLDRTLVSVALPSILRDFGGELAEGAWVLDAYILSFLITLLVAGRLGDLFGRKRLFLIGLIAFTATSAINAAAPTLAVLIGSRLVQGVGAATMTPQTLTLVTVCFPGRDRGLALGIWSAVIGLGTAIGPPLGGLLVTAFGWRAVFLVNLPLGILAFLGAWKIVGESKVPGAERRVDWAGIAVAVLMTATLTFAVIEGMRLGWGSPIIVGLLLTSALAFAAFYFVERGRPSALLPPRLFANRSFTAGNVVSFCSFFGYVGLAFLLPFFLEGQLGLSPARVGVLLTPLAGMVMVVAPISGRLTNRLGGRWLVFAGMCLAGLGMLGLTGLGLDARPIEVLLPLGVAGGGLGLAFSPTVTVVMGGVEPERVGNASGILGAFRMLGAVMGIAVLSAVLQSQVVAAASVESDRGIELLGAAPSQRFVQSEYLGSLRATFVIAALLAFLGALTALFIAPGAGRNARSGPHG